MDEATQTLNVRGRLMSVDWDTIGQQKFDRIVEALAHRKFGETATVRAFDGRGGDDGKDIEIRTELGQLIIVQLKYYPYGFSGGFGARRTKIKQSWRRIRGGHMSGRGRAAAKVKDWPAGKPSEWVLAVPCKLTPAEYRFVQGLLNGTGVALGVWDRPWLDNALALHPDLHDYLLKDDLLDERARIHREETANLLGGTADLTARLGNLGKVVNGQDPDWTWDFAHVGDVETLTLRAKHPRAAEVSPVTLNIGGVFGAEHTDIAEQFQRVVGFGARGGVTLPPQVVHSFSVDGPPIVAVGDAPGSSFTIVSTGVTGAVGESLTIDFETLPDGTRPSFSGTVQHLSHGIDGAAIESMFYGALDLELLLPMEGKGGTFRVKFDATGKSAADARRALGLLRALDTGTRASVYIGGKRLMVISGVDAEVMDDGLRAYATVVADLASIVELTGRDIAVPGEVSVYDAVMIRAVLQVLEGKCTHWPGISAVTATLNGEIDDSLRDLFAGNPVMIKLVNPSTDIDLFGTEVPLGDLTLWHPKVNVIDASEHLQALEAGSGEGRVLELSAAYGLFRAFREADFPEGERLHVTPWGIDDVEEPPEFDPAATGSSFGTPP